MSLFYYDKDLVAYSTHYDAVKSKKPCWLYYGDDFYRTVDWKTEPIFSLDVLYKTRAEEIRNKYEHVILCLSGGIDSRMVFETFYRNKIHIDEIISVGSYSQDLFTGSDENNNDEIYNNVKQLLNSVNLPNTRMRYLDYSELFKNINNFSLVEQYGNEWITKIGCWKSIHHLYWTDIKKHIIDHSKKSCLLFGEAKTLIKLANDKPYVYFLENDVSGYYPNYNDESLSRENFYFGITPIAAEIIKKQAFIMYDVYKKMPDKEVFWKNYISIYNHVIYNEYPNLIKPTRKSTNRKLSVRDKYILRHSNSDLYKIYTDGLKKLHSTIGQIDPVFYSKPYFIE